jgi:adenine-specific DNA-methyltransferase
MFGEQEKQFINNTSLASRKQKGQFFTPLSIVKLMQEWIKDKNNICDPTCGTGILLRDLDNKKTITGIDNDENCLKYLDDNIHKILSDFMNVPLDYKYDGIISNPPYIRHNLIENKKIYSDFLLQQTNIKFSLNMNLYMYILIKSCMHLEKNGKAVFLIPLEWMNSNFGQQVKQYFQQSYNLEHVIVFNNNVFLDNLSTGCLLFIDTSKKHKTPILHFADDIPLTLTDAFTCKSYKHVKYDNIFSLKKWSGLGVKHSDKGECISEFITCHRGITTGCNEFFLLTEDNRKKWNIPLEWVSPCIGKAHYLNNNDMSSDFFENLKNNNKPCWLLTINTECSHPYLLEGIKKNITNNYVLRKRKHWYFMENIKIPDIFCSVFFRSQPKFIKNTQKLCSLTCFHGIYVKDKRNIDKVLHILQNYCVDSIDNNKRIYGSHLFKMEPSDILNLKWNNSI